MKKNNLLKIFGIMFLFVLILSWAIPVNSTTTTDPIGIVNLFRIPVLTFQTFIQYFISFIAIGAFYGVLNKTGCYSKIVEKVTKKWSKNPKIFMFLTVIFFALVSALTGSTMFLFLFVPFFAAILLSLGYSNVTSLMLTVGSILVGQLGTIYGFNIVGYYVNVLGIKINSNVLVRVILFVISLAVYLFFVSKIKLVKAKTDKTENKTAKTKITDKKKTKAVEKNTVKKEPSKKSIAKKETIAEAKVIPLLTVGKTDKSLVPFIVLLILTILLCFVGLYNWFYSFGIEIFNKLDESLKAITIGSYPIVSNLINGATPLGYWGNYEFVIVLFISSAIISWIYNLSIDDYVDGIKNGAKEMIIPALYATMANIIFTYLLIGQNGTFVTTISALIAKISSSFNIFTTTLISLVSGLFYNDYYYVITSAQSVFGGYSSETLGLAGILSGAIYSLLMLLLPTSVYLVAGLKYFDVSYKEWIKNIWKYALIMFIAIIILITCIFALI